MRFRFKDIGPIECADLELGDLTLVAGRNNTGKTYIVYTLYGFLRLWPEIGLREPVRSKGFDSLLSAAKELIESGIGSSISIERRALDSYRRTLLKRNADSFSSRRIADVFSSAHDKFLHSKLHVTAPPLPLGIARTMQIGPCELQATYGEEKIQLEIRNIANRSAASRRFPGFRQAFPLHLLSEAAFPDRIEPFILSAERFGISLFYKELDFTKNRLVELLQQLGDSKEPRRNSPYLIVDRVASRYALPVKENIDYTRSIPGIRSGTGELRDAKLQDEIKDLIGGFYRASEDEIRFCSKVKSRSFNIPLHLASSSARGLSDLYFYLRHTASRNQLLVIDEPESHLDTANQVNLARVLARLVNSGIKVLVTTHSDYMIKEINNLIMLSQIDNAPSVRRRLGYRLDDALTPEKVRAYVAENSSLTRCAVDEQGVDMPVFDETIENINSVAGELTARAQAAKRRRGGDGK